MKEEEKEKEKPLDDLLSLRGKPFTDWKEERKYLRDKWGRQGRQISAESGDTIESLKGEKKQGESN
jgi:hypothetical protein